MVVSGIFSVWNVYVKALSNFPNTEQEERKLYSSPGREANVMHWD